MNLLDAARRYAQKNPAALQRGLGTAGDQVNRRTGGKHAGTIAKVQQRASALLGGGKPR